MQQLLHQHSPPHPPVPVPHPAQALRASGVLLSADDATERWMCATLEIAVAHTLAIKEQTAAAVGGVQGLL